MHGFKIKKKKKHKDIDYICPSAGRTIQRCTEPDEVSLNPQLPFEIVLEAFSPIFWIPQKEGRKGGCVCSVVFFWPVWEKNTMCKSASGLQLLRLQACYLVRPQSTRCLWPNHSDSRQLQFIFRSHDSKQPLFGLHTCSYQNQMKNVWGFQFSRYSHWSRGLCDHAFPAQNGWFVVPDPPPVFVINTGVNKSVWQLCLRQTCGDNTLAGTYITHQALEDHEFSLQSLHLLIQLVLDLWRLLDPLSGHHRDGN